MSRPSHFSQMVRNFLQSFKSSRTRNTRTVVGQDKYGNVFFEKGETVSDAKRGYEAPKHLGDSEIMHPLWEEWLRGRLNTPPTLEEQDREDIAMEMRQHAVQQTHAKEQTGVNKPVKEGAKPASAFPHVHADESQIDDGRIYPKYDEYEDMPTGKQMYEKSNDKNKDT